MKPGGLTRRTPTERAAMPARRRPLRAFTSKRDAIPTKSRAVVRARSLGFCEARAIGCWGAASHMHHIVLRSRGGRHEASNLLHVCAACHRHIHDNPAWATARGFLASNRKAKG